MGIVQETQKRRLKKVTFSGVEVRSRSSSTSSQEDALGRRKVNKPLDSKQTLLPTPKPVSERAEVPNQASEGTSKPRKIWTYSKDYAQRIGKNGLPNCVRSYKGNYLTRGYPQGIDRKFATAESKRRELPLDDMDKRRSEFFRGVIERKNSLSPASSSPASR